MKRSSGIQGKRKSAGQILTEEEVLVLVVVGQVLQLLLAILQDTEKAQAWVMILTCKRRFPAISLSYWLWSFNYVPSPVKVQSALVWLNILTL